MRIAIYHQHTDAVVGGAEYVVAVLAETLARHGDVTLVHHKAELSAEGLVRAYGVDLSGVSFRFIPVGPPTLPWNHAVHRYRRERSRYAAVLADYDLVIASVHDAPPFCPARRGALFVHFPYADQVSAWPWADDGWSPRKVLRRACARWERKHRFAGYQVVMVNSEFTREYTRRWWGLESEVVFAPAGIAPATASKQSLILSVGRFAAGGTSKHQLELVQAFGELEQVGVRGWEYDVVGGLGPDEAHNAYYRQVLAAAAGHPVRVSVNLSREQLEAHYHRARIFWHAAGLGAGDSNPVLSEHFGIVTVEAMSAGCVPVVIARGGQPEIVEHAVSGFLWHTPDELKQYTLRLIQEPELLARMSTAARTRAARFSRAAFVARVETALHPLLSK